MRITTYEKGGNSLNPVIKLFVFLIVLGLFTMPVSAFEDDFDDGEIASDWTLMGTWNVNAGGMPTGSLYSVSSTTTPSQSYSLTQSTAIFTPNYVSFWVKHTSNTDGGHAYIDFSDSQTVYILSDNIIKVHQSSGDSDIGSIANNVWNRIELTKSGTNFIVNIYDSSDTLTTTQTIAADEDDTSFIRLRATQSASGGSITTHFDDVQILTVSPSLTNNIEWDLDQYTEGETASYSWTLQNSFWQDFIYKYQIQILKDGVEIDTVRVSQTGTRFQDVDIAGNYEIKLQYSGLIFTNWQTLDSDSINVVPEVDSFINVPSTSAIKTNFTTTYLYGLTPISPIINIKVLQNDYTYKVIDTKILPAAIAGITYTTNLSISSLSPIGYYVVELYDNGQGKSFATDTIQTTYAYIPPSDVVLSSYVNTTDSIYSLGGIISGSYAIDDTNYTNYYTKLQVYNIDKDIISFSFIPLHQVDNFDIPITNSELDFYSDGVNRYPISTNFLSGENAVRLTSYNTDGSLNEVITQKNITLSIINDEGYGLTLSKYIVDETEIFAIKAITPVQASIVIHPLTLMGISDTTILINGSTQMSYAIGIADTYTISLVSGGETKITQIIKVFEDEEIIDPSIEDEVIPDTTFQDNTTSLLNSPYLIGLFIMCVFLAIGATNGIGGTIVTGSIGLGIVCYMGIFPWILLVIEVLVVAVLMAKGMINLSGD